MAGAFNPYFAQVLASLDGATPFDAGAQAAGIAPPTAAPAAPPGVPAPSALGTILASAGVPSLDLAKLGAPAPPPAAPTMIDGGDSASIAGPPINAPGISPPIREPTSFARDVPGNTNAVQVAAPANDGSSPIGPDPHAFDLVAQQGGGAPAHESDLRGPSLINAQNERQGTYANAIGTVAGRNAEAANDELQMAVSQERAARLREQAYQQSIAEQDEELQARQDDFDTTARQMARVGQIDHGRFWASRSTGQKIAGAIEVMLAGFRGAPSMVMKRIDDDVKAQEFAYGAARDATQAKQTAFSAAMAKYGNINAARAMARVASLDVVSAQLGQIAAMNKGNETGNRAIEAMAQLTNDRMMMIQQGIKFMPATAGQRYFVNPRTGVIYNNKEAMAYDAKNQEYGQEDRKQTAGIGGQILVQRDKAALENEQGGGLGKENAQKLALEQAKGQIERDALLAAIGYGQDNVKAIVKGGVTDDAIAHAPAWAPGATQAREMVSTRESYNNTARLAVAAAYKLSTDATEPKNRALLEEYAGPYVIGPGDNEASARHKMQLLRGLVERGAASKGVSSPGAKPAEMPGSFTVPKK